MNDRRKDDDKTSFYLLNLEHMIEEDAKTYTQKEGYVLCICQYFILYADLFYY